MALALATDATAEERAAILSWLAVAEAEAVRLEDGRRRAEESLDAMAVAGTDRKVRVEFLATTRA